MKNYNSPATNSVSMLSDPITQHSDQDLGIKTFFICPERFSLYWSERSSSAISETVTSVTVLNDASMLWWPATLFFKMISWKCVWFYKFSNLCTKPIACYVWCWLLVRLSSTNTAANIKHTYKLYIPQTIWKISSAFICGGWYWLQLWTVA